jgi:hypothetical protein
VPPNWLASYRAKKITRQAFSVNLSNILNAKIAPENQLGSSGALLILHGSVANAKFLAHFGLPNIAHSLVNQGFEKEQFRCPLFGGTYLQHNPP